MRAASTVETMVVRLDIQSVGLMVEMMVPRKAEKMVHSMAAL